MIKKRFKIGNKKIGEDEKCLIVAEISANHNKNFKITKKLIDSAHRNGADLIKIQTYTADTLTINSKRKDFQISKKNSWKDSQYLWKLYKKAETSNEMTKKIFNYCKSKNITVFSSPFDMNTIDFLESLDCPAYKIASPEITHLPLIKRAAKTNKPIILSLGLAEKEDIKIALEVIKKEKNNKVILLQCVSSYPAAISEQNLRSINNIRNRYKFISGFSDHTKGYVAPMAAVAFGAKMIEKHFNIKNNKSVDSFFSTDEKDFNLMVKNIRLVESSLGNGQIKVSKSSKKNFGSRRSIYVSSNIKKGELITKKNIKIIRPGYGLHPKYFHLILNKRSNKSLKKGDRLKIEHIQKK
jgi:pseudaminic acid synthase